MVASVSMHNSYKHSPVLNDQLNNSVSTPPATGKRDWLLLAVGIMGIMLAILLTVSKAPSSDILMKDMGWLLMTGFSGIAFRAYERLLTQG